MLPPHGAWITEAIIVSVHPDCHGCTTSSGYSPILPACCLCPWLSNIPSSVHPLYSQSNPIILGHLLHLLFWQRRYVLIMHTILVLLVLSIKTYSQSYIVSRSKRHMFQLIAPKYNSCNYILDDGIMCVAFCNCFASIHNYCN